MTNIDHRAKLAGLPDIGAVVAGKYRLERLLGRGGVGVVFEAEHVKLRQRVAVKFLAAEMHEHKEMVERFEREARAMARLGGPYVARVTDVDQTEDGLSFLVMELLNGHDLQNELKQRGPLPIAEAVRWVRLACLGMRDVHAAGVVHRDLKPANLFLVELPNGERTLKIMDFGISKIAGEDIDVTMTATSLGTPAYMSPEQVRSAKHIDARADVWSLGVILYRLLSGKLPFHGSGSTGMAVSIVNEPPTPLEEVAPHVPTGLAEVVRKTMAKSPDERFASVQALADALLPYESATVAAVTAVPPLPPRAPTAATVPMTAAPDAGKQETTGPSLAAHAVFDGLADPKPAPPPPRKTARAGWIVGGVALAALGLGAALVLTLGGSSARTRDNAAGDRKGIQGVDDGDAGGGESDKPKKKSRASSADDDTNAGNGNNGGNSGNDDTAAGKPTPAPAEPTKHEPTKEPAAAPAAASAKPGGKPASAPYGSAATPAPPASAPHRPTPPPATEPTPKKPEPKPVAGGALPVTL